MIKIPEKVWCISPQHKAEEVYVISYQLSGCDIIGREIDINKLLTYEVDKYSEPNNSYTFKVKANRCYDSKSKLLNNL